MLARDLLDYSRQHLALFRREPLFKLFSDPAAVALREQLDNGAGGRRRLLRLLTSLLLNPRLCCRLKPAARALERIAWQPEPPPPAVPIKTLPVNCSSADI